MADHFTELNGTATNMAGELPQRRRERGGAGWWLDERGYWREPKDWPGDEPPVEKWVRSDDGAWCPPDETDPVRDSNGTGSQTRPSTLSTVNTDLAHEPTQPPPSTRSSMAVLLVGATAVSVAVVISVWVLFTQSGADALPEEHIPAIPEVVFAADTEQSRTALAEEKATGAPAVAKNQLAELGDQSPGPFGGDQNSFDETLWETQPTDCLDIGELVLIERSSTPIEWADNLGCVPAEGTWFDPYLDAEIHRTIDAEVSSLVPLEIVHSSGGSEWTPATRERFLTDITHRATMVIVSRDSGQNPRSQSPDQWRPSNEESWCGYAVDWIAVKHRWELTVTTAERVALTEMLDTCSQPMTNGPHLSSMTIEPVTAPLIQRTGAN